MESIPNKKYFLDKPKNLISTMSKLPTKPLWVNLFGVKMLQNFTFYTYIVRFTPDIDYIRQKRFVFYAIEKEIMKVYGDLLIFSGDNMFGTLEVKDLQCFSVKYKNGVDYKITITKTEETINVNKYNPLQNQAVKRITEEILKTILRANPFLELNKDFFVKISEKKTIFDSVDFYPGFKNSIHYLSQGNYTSISIKNRILSKMNCLEIIKVKIAELQAKNLKLDQIYPIINDHFEERTIKTIYKGKKTYKISKVNFNKDRTPKTTSFLYDGKIIFLI